MPATVSATAAARGTRNTLRQPRSLTMKPVTMGAVAGPMVIMAEPMARYVPRRPWGTRSTMTFIMSGMNTPVPTACTSRATRSSRKFGARKPPAEPAMLKAAAAKNSVRIDRRRYR